MSLGAIRALPDDPDERQPGRSWREVLRDEVRAEFQVEVYFPRPGDPVLFGPTCAVSGCPARGVNRSLGLKATGANRSTGTRFRGYLCLAHVRIWRRVGEPAIDAWVRNAGLTGPGQAAPVSCRASGCPRSARSNGLCNGHTRRWSSAGRPDLEAFVVSAPAVAVGVEGCSVPRCGFPSAGADGFCDKHAQRYFNARYRRLGLTPDGFLEMLAEGRRIAAPRFDMRGLPGVVQLEMGLALQARKDAGRSSIQPLTFGQVTRWVKALGVESVLDRSEAFWVASARERFRPSVRGNPMWWLRFVRRTAQLLRERDVEIWGLDTWPVDRLDLDGRYAHQPGRRIYFSEIDPTWLRELVKRWARWRITTATKSPASISNATAAIREFCRWTESDGVTLDAPSAITRHVLERYLAAVRSQKRSVSSMTSYLTELKVFLDDVRLHDWAPGLPANATYFKGEIPRQQQHLPRCVDEFVMGQIDNAANLARLPDHTTRTAIVILVETGLRSVDALRLPFDPVTVDEAGAPYLMFRNHKFSREAVIPISHRLLAQIRTQQRDLDERFGTPRPPYLLPAIRANAGGTRPLSWATLQRRLQRWLEDCDVRDATGERVRVTAHQFRHTLGTRMINNEVPLPAIQRMLDHQSPEMTLRYARIKDQTLRREWERYQQRVTITGEVVRLDPDGPLSDAAWAKENLARAKQTLPNGYCALPLQQSCPHPNACLTCDSFLTTIEFLPAHREQLMRTTDLIAKAEADGARRLVDMNEPVRLNLVRIIEGLEGLADDA